jgi:Cof subfamily protein (haloacid dehalogenase superfamily)
MGERAVVFLDVDGTLVPDTGQVPDSARAAIREARAAGHLVYLCTGRSLVELWPEILDIGFDGVVAASGSYVEAAGAPLVHHQLSAGQVRHVQDFFAAHDVGAYFQANDGIYATPHSRERLRRVIRRSIGDESVLAELDSGLFGFVDSIRVDADPVHAPITKVIFFDTDLTLGQLEAEFADEFEVVRSSVPLFGPGAGEMSLRGIHKAAGMDVLLAHLGLPLADTIALGDSYNDLEMLAHAGVGIAMGNAPAPVRDVADEVTAAPEDDGIALAFRRHGLIG